VTLLIPTKKSTLCPHVDRRVDSYVRIDPTRTTTRRRRGGL